MHDPLEEFIGSCPGLTAATDLEALRDEWERGNRRYHEGMSAAPLEDGSRHAHTARVGRRRQVTLSPDVLADANLHVGDRVRVEVVGEGVLRLVRDRHPLLDLAGAFPGLSEATDLEALRDEWER